MALPYDYSVIGIVLAISLTVIILSGLALYLAFRVRETFREEGGRRGMRTIKLIFLLGLLFLAGGIFYFSASGIDDGRAGGSGVGGITSATSSVNNVSHVPSTATSSSDASLTSFSPSSATKSSGTTSYASSTNSSSTSAVPVMTMTLSYPSKVNVGQVFDMSITLTNAGPSVVSSVDIQAGNIFAKFGVASSSSPVSGNVIMVGDMVPGSTVVNLQLAAPSQPQQFSGTLSLTFQPTSEQVSATVTIRIAQA